jgi:hypothetical protein
VDAGIPVYTIGLAPSFTMASQLATIARETGGYYEEAPGAIDMEALYADIAQNIRGHYLIRYTTHDPVQNGTLRTVTVHYNDQNGIATYTAPGVFNPNFPAIDHTPVTAWQENLAIPISASVTDPDVGDSVSRVTLSSRISGTDPTAVFTAVDMASAGGDAYSGTIPADQATLAGVEYFITAEDTRGGISENGSASAPHFIAISTAQPPVARAGQDAAVSEGEVFVLDGAGSMASTADGALDYAWGQVSGTVVVLSNSEIAGPSFTAPMTGPSGTDLVFELRVTDSAGRIGTDTVTVTVNDFLAPGADFSWNPASPAAEQAVSFTDASTPTGGAVVAWLWDFGGAGTSTEPNPEFIFPRSGTYPVKLTATDEYGSVGTTVKTVTVSEPVCPGGDCSGSGGCFIGAAGREL